MPAQRGLKGPRGGRQVVGPEGDHLLVQGGPVPGGQAAGGVPDELLLIQREPLGLAVIVADLELAAAAAVGCQLALGGSRWVGVLGTAYRPMKYEHVAYWHIGI